MKFVKSFQSMQTGFGLLLLISLFASFVDLTSSAATSYFFGFYTLVILFVINLSLYVVNKIKNIIQLLKMPTSSRRRLYMGLGRHLSLLAVHAGIALIFLGNIMDLSLGYNQHFELRPGQSIKLPATQSALNLEDFQIDYYQDGSPSQYTARVLVNEENNKEDRYDISVNHPLEISGSKIYQESYGYRLKIEIDNGDISKKYIIKVGDGAQLGDNKIEIIRYIPNFTPMHGQGTPSGPAVIYYIPQKDITGAAILGEKVKIGDNEYLTFVDKQAFTVLNVKTSPGLQFVMSGGALLVIGIMLVFLFINKKSPQIDDGYKDVASND